jgi:hypothetical protein
VPRLGTLPLAVCAACGPPSRGPTGTIAPLTRPLLSGRQVLLFHASARDELTPPLHRAPPGQHAGRPLAEGTHMRAFVPGIRRSPGFDAIVPPIDASAVVHVRSSSRRTPDPLTAGLFPQRSPPRLLTGAACGGLGSPPARRTRRTYLHHWHSTVHAGDLLHRLTPLSGHTPERRLGERSPRPSPSLSVISRSTYPMGHPTLGWFGVTDPLEASIGRARCCSIQHPVAEPTTSCRVWRAICGMSGHSQCWTAMYRYSGRAAAR